MSSSVVMGDQLIARIPVDERGDALIDVRQHAPELRWSTLYAEPTGAYSRLRTGVLQRLRKARNALPPGYDLLLVEGYRPYDVQQRYYEDHCSELLERYGPLEPDTLRGLASRHVSPPDVAPHVSGAAIDLVLSDAEGNALDMGTRINATPDESDGACYLDAPNITDFARGHRDILATAMATAGFAAYPPEWWHWSYGDRYWAFTLEVQYALYGPVHP
ncbi:dipeptidase [Aeromicrobium phragmitis]|uniref:D-alanyl-D-alanine dipeptidase n=1 Tax=Aeromicrobium phragmitis TaxID=2478914 RepID=A0A3L8PLK8_9ACTN|nr:M15 family metallopeptidase [Aeromicrobium phragmitis]RLV56267.1 dipeptidase [Aeromicrobium phragmitis]